MTGKTFLAVLILAFGFVQISAQDTKLPKLIKILNNYGAIPFEDGKTVITEIKFTGLDSEYEKFDKTVRPKIPESDFLRFMRESRATINPDEKFYGSKVSKAAKLLREWLAEYGYREADVNAFGEPLPKNRMKLIFEIKRGLPARVSEIRFDGNINISGEEYFNQIIEYVGDDWKIYQPKIYRYFIQECLRDLMKSKGFIKGKILSVLPERKNGNLIVKINLKEGFRYRIGDIKFDGIKVFTEKELLEMLGIKSGDIANADKIVDFLDEKLKRFYADKGYILYDSEFDPEFIEPQIEGLDAIVNFEITIDEGNQFKITKIKFVGSSEQEISEDEEKELQDTFPLKETEIFNQTKLEEGIKKLNETEKFYPIDDDRDVEIRTRQPVIRGSLLIDSNGITIMSKNELERISRENPPDVEIVVKVIKIKE